MSADSQERYSPPAICSRTGRHASCVAAQPKMSRQRSHIGCSARSLKAHRSADSRREGNDPPSQPDVGTGKYGPKPSANGGRRIWRTKSLTARTPAGGHATPARGPTRQSRKPKSASSTTLRRKHEAFLERLPNGPTVRPDRRDARRPTGPAGPCDPTRARRGTRNGSHNTACPHRATNDGHTSHNGHHNPPATTDEATRPQYRDCGNHATRNAKRVRPAQNRMGQDSPAQRGHSVEASLRADARARSQGKQSI